MKVLVLKKVEATMAWSGKGGLRERREGRCQLLFKQMAVSWTRAHS